MIWCACHPRCQSTVTDNRTDPTISHGRSFARVERMLGIVRVEDCLVPQRAAALIDRRRRQSRGADGGRGSLRGMLLRMRSHGRFCDFSGFEKILFRRLPYDFETTIRKIYSIPELEPFLGDRLRQGR